ncbi:MAG: DEAD/DEAH box helicase [Desulfobacula sp.]|jgi:superfamily II DNA or RNA helicase|nr:DEAD/DEAH box helicase [Desulfobacula sp.]
MDFKLKNKLYLSGMKAETLRAIKTRLTMNNPAYSEAEKMGRFTSDIEPELKFYEETRDALICPRGVATQIYRICQTNKENIKIIDNRRTLNLVDFTFHGKLRPLQSPAVKSCLSKDFGLLEAPTGSGKTAIALYMIAERQQPALIVVHTKELLNQWIDRVEQFLKIPRDEIGIIGSGRFTIGKKITVAMIQTLVKKADDVAPHVGYLILDECHRAPAMQYVKAIEAFDCKYMTGLTATPWRRDGLSKVIFWHIGDVTGGIDKQDLLDNGNLCQAEVKWITTEFNTLIDASVNYSKALSELTEDHDRNQLICNTVSKNTGTGISLILSDRRNHCQTLHDTMLKENGIKSKVLTGATSKTERERIINDLQNGRCKYLIATGQLIGEGFDLPEISIMFLVTPIKFSGRVIQYIGRALRPAPGKDKAVIFDFVDVLNPVFKSSAMSRLYTYRQEQIAV